MENRSEWKFKGGAGRYAVWHAGKNLYYVTEGRDGPVVGSRDQFGLAFKLATVLHDLS